MFCMADIYCTVAKRTKASTPSEEECCYVAVKLYGNIAVHTLIVMFVIFGEVYLLCLGLLLCSVRKILSVFMSS